MRIIQVSSAWPAYFFLGVTPFAFAANARLSPSERSALRYRIENLWNEVDLLLKNAETDRRDVQRQEREFKDFRVYEKIPILRPGHEGEFEKRIAESARSFGLKLTRTEQISVSAPGRPIPKVVPSDSETFRLTEDQLVEKLRLKLTIAGTKRDLQAWMDSWDQAEHAQTPLLEWDPSALTSLPIALPGQVYVLQIQALCFRDIHFPKLRPRDPLLLLPAWARHDPAGFRSQEPFLWKMIIRTRTEIPNALPQYDLRAELELNSERMSFFTARVARAE